jgi:hypothetical protein
LPSQLLLNTFSIFTFSGILLLVKFVCNIENQSSPPPERIPPIFPEIVFYTTVKKVSTTLNVRNLHAASVVTIVDASQKSLGDLVLPRYSSSVSPPKQHNLSVACQMSSLSWRTAGLPFTIPQNSSPCYSRFA